MLKYDIILIHPPYTQRNGSGTIFPLGLGYIYASIEAFKYSAKIIDLALYFNFLTIESIRRIPLILEKYLNKYKPNLAIGIGPCTSNSFRSLREIAKICKKIYPEIPIVYGGPILSVPEIHKYFFTDFKASALIVGDGEIAIIHYLNALKRGKNIDDLNEIITSSNSMNFINIIDNLDSIHFPKRNDVFKNKTYKLSLRREFYKNPFTTMVTSRGCPYNCSFCFVGNHKQRIYKKRSIDNILNEMTLLIKQQVKTIVFYDDNFFSTSSNDELEILHFITEIKKRKLHISWQIEMRPDVLIETPIRLIKMLFHSGCQQINIGIEIGYNKISQCSKNVSTDKLRKKLFEIRKIIPELRFTGTFIIGSPGEDVILIKETIEYSQQLELLFAHYNPLSIYPGSVLFNQFFPNNNIDMWYREITKETNFYGDFFYENAHLPRIEIFKKIKQAYTLFYNRNEWRDLVKYYYKNNYIFIIENVLHKFLKNRFLDEDT